MPKIQIAKHLPSVSPAERHAALDTVTASAGAAKAATKAKLDADLEVLTPKVNALNRQRQKGNVPGMRAATLKDIKKFTGKDPIAAVNMDKRGGTKGKANYSSDTEVRPDVPGDAGTYRGDKHSAAVRRGKKAADEVPDTRTHTGLPEPKKEPKYVRASNPDAPVHNPLHPLGSEPAAAPVEPKVGPTGRPIHPGFVPAGPGETAGHVVKPKESDPPQPEPELKGDIVANPNAGAVKHDTRIPSAPRKEPKTIMVTGGGDVPAPTERHRVAVNPRGETILVPGVRAIGSTRTGGRAGSSAQFSHAGRPGGPSRPGSSFRAASQSLSRGRAAGIGSSNTTNPVNLDKKKNENGEVMNPDKIANAIIREAFTSGPENTTSGNNSMGADGNDQRAMLAGEWLGSVAWPFQQTTSKDFEKTKTLQDKQSKSGMGDGHGCGFQESIGKEIVDDLLEDSPSAIFSDPESVGYLINELQESGYTEEAATISAICEDAKPEDVVKIADMLEKMEASKADAFLIEQVSKFATLLMEDDSNTTSDKDPEDKPNTDEPDAAAKTDNNSTGVEP